MAARHAELFTVSDVSDLEALEQLLEDGETESITVNIPDGATTLFNARDFRRVIEAARSSAVRLSISTDDPMRRELARIMGFRIATSPQHFSEPAADVHAQRDACKREIIGPTTAEIEPLPDMPNPEQTVEPAEHDSHEADTVHVPMSLDSASDDESDATDTFEDDNELSEASFSFVITPPIPRRPGLEQGDTISEGSDSQGLPEFELWDRRQARTQRQPRVSRRRVSRGVAILAVATTIILLAALLMGLVLPSATIAITPQVRDVSATLTYGVALPGTNYDISIPPDTISATVTYSGSIATTGQRTEPDATAVGSILLTNPLTSEVTIAAGTTITAASGTEFVVTDDVTVPAADPYGSLTFGSATAGIRASAPGIGGNVDADAISGQLESAVFYTNRDATSGGSNKTIKTVTQADVDKLQRQAMADLDVKAAGAIATKVAPGQQVVDNSEQRQPMQATLDHSVGQDAELLKIDASMQVTAQAYRPDALTGQAQSAAQQKLSEQAGPDAELVADSVHVGSPTPIDGASGTAFSVSASGRLQSRIDEAALEAIRNDLTGVSTEASLARIEQVPGVGSASIQQSRSWLTSGMPHLASHITIEVQGAKGIPTEAASTRP
jgi:hypothetical protein